MNPTFIPPDPRFDQLATGHHVVWTSTPQADFDLQFPAEGLIVQTATAELTAAMSVGGQMQPVVVKRFLPGDEQQDRFKRETEMLAHFRQHPNIVDLVGAHRTETERYIVTERMDTTLAQHIEAERPFPKENAIGFGEQLASALAMMHQTGAAHGDVTPENVGLDAVRATAKLMDFDLATVGGDLAGDIAGLASVVGFAMTGIAEPKKQRKKLPRAASEIFSAGLDGGRGASVGEWMGQFAHAMRGTYKPKEKRPLVYNIILVAIVGVAGFGIWWQLKPVPPPPAALACEQIQYLEDNGPPPLAPEAKAKPVIAKGKLQRAADALRTRDELVSRFKRARRGKRKLSAQIAEREQDALRLIGSALGGLAPSIEAQRLLDAVGTQTWRRKAVEKVRTSADKALASADDKAYYLAMERLYRLDPGDPEARFARKHGSAISIAKEDAR